MSKFKKPKTLVKVTWGDAWGSSGWSGKDVSADHKPLIVVSVGFVAVHDARGISLASGIDENGSHVGVGFIPSGMIIKVTSL